MKKMLMFLHRDDSRVGGAEEVMYNVCQHLLQEGWHIDVLFSSPTQTGGWDSQKSNLHLHYVKGNKITLMFHLLYWFWTRRKIRYDRSFTSLVDHTAFLGLMRRIGFLRIDKMVGRESTSIFTRFTGIKLAQMKFAYHLGYPAIDLLICQTEFMKEQLLAHLPWLERYMKVCVIPNPINREKIRRMEKEPLDVSPLQPYIISAGRYIPEKGFDILIRSFAKLRTQFPTLRLVILGEGAERKKLQQIIEEEGLQDNTILYGLVKNVYPYFRQARMCVVSSRIEGFPNVLLQMMSQNDNVVSTTCAGGIENISGLYTCPPNNDEALTKTMETCLHTDNMKCRTLFNTELNKRSIEHFVESYELNLS